MVAVNVFYSKIGGNRATGSAAGDTVMLVDPRDSVVKTFAVNTSIQQSARIAGIALSYEQPFGNTPCGFTSSLSRARTRVDNGFDDGRVGVRSQPRHLLRK